MSENKEERDLGPPSGAATKLLVWFNRVFDQVVAGGLGIPGIEDAGPPPASRAEAERQIGKAIRYATIEAGSVGFLTSVGGVITLPVSLPAGMAGALVIQMRMLAKIAHLRGYDVRDPAVRSTILLCLIGSSSAEAVKGAGVAIAGKLGISALRQLPGSVLIRINQLVGFRLLTKFGTKGVVNLTRLVPLAGGPVGAVMDATGTRIVANVARRMLPYVEPSGEK